MRRSPFCLFVFIGLLVAASVVPPPGICDSRQLLVILEPGQDSGAFGAFSGFSEAGLFVFQLDDAARFQPGQKLNVSRRSGELFLVIGEFEVSSAKGRQLILSPLKVFGDLQPGIKVKITRIGQVGGSSPNPKVKSPDVSGMGELPRPLYENEEPVDRPGESKADPASELNEILAASSIPVEKKGPAVRPDEPVHKFFSGSSPKPSSSDDCLSRCLQKNQMASAQGGTLMEQCRQKCSNEQRLKEALSLIGSSQPGAYSRGVRMLCSIDDRAAVEPLIQALDRELKERKGLWVWIIPALGDRKDTRAVPVLLKGLKLDHMGWIGCEKAVNALGRIGDPRALPALLEAAQMPHLRMAAIEALGRFPDVRVVPVLIAALDDGEDEEVADAAARGLAALGALAVPEAIEAFRPKEYSSEYPETKKRLRLCRLLGKSRDPQALKALEAALSDPDPQVARCASVELQADFRNKKEKF